MTPVYESYANALFKSAEALGCADDVAGELSAMETLVKQCGGYLSSPLIGTGKKTALLRELLDGKVSPLTLEFMLLITARRHIRHFYAAAEQFRRLSGHGNAVVRLRVPFTPEHSILEKLKARLIKEKLIPTNVADTQFQIIEDKTIIGGFVASCDGYQIDTSLRTALMRLLRPERLVHSDD